MDDRGFPDQSDDYDTLLHNADGGPILCKLKHPAPSLDDPDLASIFHLKRHFMAIVCGNNLTCLILTPPFSSQ